MILRNNNNNNQQLNDIALHETASPNFGQQQQLQRQQQNQQQNQQQQHNQQQQQQQQQQHNQQQQQQQQQQQLFNNQLPSPVTPTQFVTTSRPIFHPVKNPNNPFLNNQNNFQEETTLFNTATEAETPPFETSPNVGFQPFRPPPWYFNETANSDVQTTEFSGLVEDDFHPSPQILLGEFATSENPNFTPHEATSFFESLAEMAAHSSDLPPEEGLSKIPIVNMTRAQIVEHFKIRESALQAIIHEMLDDNFTPVQVGPKSGPKISQPLKQRPQVSETELQLLLQSLNKEELETPRSGAWNIRTTTGVNFINVLRTHFLYERLFSA